MTTAEIPTRLRPSGRRAARSTRRCASCRARSATPCSRSTVLPAGRRHRGFARSARPAPPPQLDRWRADIDAIYAGTPPVRVQGLAQPVRRVRIAPRRFPSRHRRHGNGRDRRHPRARQCDARPLLQPGRERCRPPVGARLRHGGGDRRRARPSPRPRAPAHQYPARPRRGRGVRASLPAGGGAARRRHRRNRARGGALAPGTRQGLRAAWPSARAPTSPRQT